MPTFTISVVNEEFTARNERELMSCGAAREEAIRGALQIGTDVVVGGKSFFGAEVTILEGSEVLDRFVIAIDASSLK